MVTKKQAIEFKQLMNRVQRKLAGRKPLLAVEYSHDFEYYDINSNTYDFYHAITSNKVVNL